MKRPPIGRLEPFTLLTARIVQRFAHIARHHPRGAVPGLFYRACKRQQRYNLMSEVAYAGGFWRVYVESHGYLVTDADLKARAYAKWIRSHKNTGSDVVQRLVLNRHAAPIEADAFLGSESPQILRIFKNSQTGSRVELHREPHCWKWHYFRADSGMPYASDVVGGVLEFESLVEAGEFGHGLRLTFPRAPRRNDR